MSVEAQIVAVREAPPAVNYLARVRLPDASEQDVELSRGADGALAAELVDGSIHREPDVRLDFTHGATPRVTWNEGAQVPLAASLEVVAQICQTLARAANGEPEPLPIPTQPLLTADAVEPVVDELVRHSRAPMIALASMALMASALAGYFARPTPSAQPIAAIPAALPIPIAAEPKPIAPPAPPVVEVPKPIEPAPIVAQPAPARAKRHAPELRQVVEHVSGLAPGTGLVALRTRSGLEVAIDGAFVGLTPVKPLSLGEGPHLLELRRTGQKSVSLELGVADGDKTTLFLAGE